MYFIITDNAMQENIGMKIPICAIIHETQVQTTVDFVEIVVPICT
jgi:hypothetical protein